VEAVLNKRREMQMYNHLKIPFGLENPIHVPFPPASQSSFDHVEKSILIIMSHRFERERTADNFWWLTKEPHHKAKTRPRAFQKALLALLDLA